MKAVLISVQPNWVEKICHKIGENKDGTPIYEKRVEVRKTKPKLETPFKAYIYCTLKGNNEFFKEDCNGDIAEWNRSKMALKKGKVIGEFICDFIRTEKEVACGLVDAVLANASCVNVKDLIKYANGNFLYSWHISNLVIYDKPKELSEFKQCHKCEYYANCYEHEYSCDGVYNLTRPPQSWCYVEENRG